MTLGFSTKFKYGQPTFFIEKIWESILKPDMFWSKDYLMYAVAYKEKFGREWDGLDLERLIHERVNPKLHTMREDTHNKWHAGMDIHPVINNRTANRFQFAPTIKCVSTQDIYMTYFRNQLEVTIDEKYKYWDTIDALVKNDGFYNTGQFVKWFFPIGKRKWIGKIIHWTDLKY